MSIIADTLKKKRTSGSSDKIEDLLSLAKEEGVAVKEPKQKVSLSNKIFGFLSAGETAPLAQSLLRGEGFSEAIKKQGKVSKERLSGKGLTDAPTYEDILEQQFGVKEDSPLARIGGVAGDILLDPTTYIGAGAVKSIGKKFVSPIAKGVSKTGTVGKFLRKTPVISKAVGLADDAVDLARKAFDPLANLRKSLPGKADEVKELLDVGIKGGRFEEGIAEEQLRKLITPEFAKTVDGGKVIGNAIETGTVDSLPDTLKPIGEYLQKGFKEMFGEESSQGLVKGNLENYMAHVLTPEARKFFKGVEGGFDPSKLGFGKGRKLEGSASEINKSYKKRLNEAGVEPFDLFEEDALKAFTVRKKSSIRALTHKGIVNNVEKTFGETAESLLDEGGKFFRGGLPFDKKKLTDRGLSLTKDKNIAKEFATGPKVPIKFEGGEVLKGKKGLVEELSIAKDARKLDFKDVPQELKEFYEKENQILGMEKISEWAKNKGYDFIKFPNSIEARVLNPDVISKPGKKFGNNLIIKDGVRYVQTPGDALRFFEKDLDKLNKLGDPTSIVGAVKNVRPYIPEAIAEELVNMNKLFINDKATNELAQNYDKVLNMWKKSVTGFFPAFHGRNMIGGMFNNFLAGVKNPTRYAQAEKLARGVDEAVMIGGKQLDIAGKPQTYKSLLEFMNKRGIVGGQGFLDIAATVDKTSDIAKIGGPGKVGRLVSKGPENVMNAIETRLRGTLLLDSLHKGDSISDATKKVFKYHFDYAPEAFTPFERNIARRIVPFYTWTRKNIPLQFEQIIAQPGKFSGIAKVGRTLEGDIDTEDLPDYMREGFVIKAGEKDGVPRILYNLGLPVGDVNKLNKADALSLVSPFIKTPLEIMTNKNFFFDKPLDESNRPPKGFEKAPKFLKNAVGYNEKTNVADPVRWHLLTAMAGRFLFTGTRLASNESLSEDFGITSLEQILGVKSKELEGSFAPESQKEFRQKDLLKELQQNLKNKGVLYETSIFGKAEER